MSRAPSLHRRSQSGEMESLLSTSSDFGSREASLDQPDYLQVPMLHPPDCNGTGFHLHDDAPLTALCHSDTEEDEIEEVQLLDSFKYKSVGLFEWTTKKLPGIVTMSV